jgi:tetratricopeptide (TPR) repeat protein
MTRQQDDPSVLANLLKSETVLVIRGRAHAGSCDLHAEWFESATFSPLWGRQYQGNREEITAVEEDIFGEVVCRLIPDVSNEFTANPHKLHTTLPQAYQLYLKGRYLWNRRTPDALIKAIRHYREALDSDPLFALAYAGMADAYLTLGTFLFLSPQDSLPQAKRAAAKALEIDATLAEALTTLACTRAFYDWEWEDAARKFEAATALDPAYAVGRQWYGFCLCATGQFDAGFKQLHEGLELDPLSSMIETQIAAAFYLQRRFNEAIQICEKVLRTDPHFWAALLFLGQCHDCMKQYSKAVSELKAASDYSGGAPLAVASLGHALGRTGAEGEAESLLSGLMTKTSRDYVPKYCLSLVSCGLAKYDDAIKYLEGAQLERSPAIALWIRGEPRLDPLRNQLRFHQLLKNMHLDE